MAPALPNASSPSSLSADQLRERAGTVLGNGAVSSVWMTPAWPDVWPPKAGSGRVIYYGYRIEPLPTGMPRWKTYSPHGRVVIDLSAPEAAPRAETLTETDLGDIGAPASVSADLGGSGGITPAEINAAETALVNAVAMKIDPAASDAQKSWADYKRWLDENRKLADAAGLSTSDFGRWLNAR